MRRLEDSWGDRLLRGALTLLVVALAVRWAIALLQPYWPLLIGIGVVALAVGWWWRRRFYW